tara:strand:+ start:249 stop:635 length:387 start_codon:yes stop_codon:yes gene_type:complete
MSTLQVATIKSQSSDAPVIQNSSGTEKGQFAKAWANLSGDSNPPTLRRSFNVSSVTDHGNGDYTFNFAEAMSNTAYVCIPSAGNGNDCAFAVAQDSAQATGSIRCVYRTTRTSNATDFPLTMMVVFGQ